MRLCVFQSELIGRSVSVSEEISLHPSSCTFECLVVGGSASVKVALCLSLQAFSWVFKSEVIGGSKSFNKETHAWLQRSFWTSVTRDDMHCNFNAICLRGFIFKICVVQEIPKTEYWNSHYFFAGSIWYWKLKTKHRVNDSLRAWLLEQPGDPFKDSGCSSCN